MSTVPVLTPLLYSSSVFLFCIPLLYSSHTVMSGYNLCVCERERASEEEGAREREREREREKEREASERESKTWLFAKRGVKEPYTIV